ncbi:hypothetical protein [Streptomyces sp. NPDC005533]|uniref:hypothetical protein n=1 Tax=Streptomyces sp. NPDC005533 TaxID=3364723 RepID=UPI00367DDDD6
MMRCTARLLGACAAAAVLALATPATAQAAQGILFIDGVPNRDPSGCFPLGDFAPPEVSNHTDGTAWVWTGPHCDGRVVQAIFTGQATIAHGRSVYIE